MPLDFSAKFDDRAIISESAGSFNLNKSRILVFAGVALSAVFLWLAFRHVAIEDLRAALETVDMRWAWLFIFALAAFCWFKAVRWSVLLESVGNTSPRQLVAPVIVGYAATTLMPMQMGELVRAYVASKVLGIRVAAALGSIALERLLDILVLLAIVTILLIAGAHPNASFGRAAAWLLAPTVLAFAIIAFLVLMPHKARSILRQLCQLLPGKSRQSLYYQLEAALSGVAAIGRPAAYLRIVLTSVLQWSFMLACVWISLRAVGLHLPITATLAVLAATLLGMSLPSGPGYVGTIQVAFVIALEPFGTSHAIAMAASFFFHLLLCGILLFSGGSCLLLLGIKWRELRPLD